MIAAFGKHVKGKRTDVIVVTVELIIIVLTNCKTVNVLLTLIILLQIE